MPFPLLGAGIAAGAGGLFGALSSIFGKDKKEWTDADLTKMGWKDYDTGEANKLLLQNAATLMNRRRSNANAKAAQLGLDPVKSSWGMQEDIMEGVASQAGDIYGKGIESSQNKARLLASLNASEEDDSGDIFSDILSGAGLGLNAYSRFYKPMNTGGILPNDPEVPKNKDVYPTMLAKNEGVLNSEAMSLPGVKEMVKKLNKVGLSLRTPSSRSSSGHSPLVRGRQHLKDGGVIGEAKKEETTKKKTRKGAGTSLKDRIMEMNYNPGDIMKEVGYDTFQRMMGGAELDGMNPGMLKLAEINDILSDKYGYYPTNDGFHRVESGMGFNPVTGIKLKVGRQPEDHNAVGEIDFYDEEDKVVPPRFTMHSHDFNPQFSPADNSVMNNFGGEQYISSMLNDPVRMGLLKNRKKRVGQGLM